MANCFLSARAAWLGIGIVIGLVIGVVLPHAPLHAVATDRQDTFAIATGMVDDGIEAVYMLDFLTGDLRAAVLNPNTRTFSSTFQRNLGPDLKVEQGKNPRYLMVTGAVDLRGGAGGGQFGNSALYVAELSSGNMGVYTLPWTPGNLNRAMNPIQAIILLQTVQFRTAAVHALNRVELVVQIVFNGHAREVSPGTTVAALLSELGLSPRQVAVEVNQELVPRARHDLHQLAQGDQLEVVTLVGGG